jgi:succinoglycan biosynthesis transport protein ExoP
VELRHYASILNHRKWLVLLTTILTMAVVAAGSYWMTPIYTASGLLRVAQPTSDVVSTSDLTYGTRLIQTYVQVLKSRPFLEETSNRLGLGLPADELADLIRVEAIPSTELIRISVNDRDPKQAAATANTLGDLLIEQGQKLYTGGGKDALQVLRDQLAAVETQLAEDRADHALAGSATPESAGASSLATKIRAEEETYSMLLSQYEKARLEAALRANSISVVEPAKVPELPSQPNVKKNLALAAAVGLLAGIALAFLSESLTPTIHSPDELPAITKVELVGRIPRLRLHRRFWERGRALEADAESAPQIEAFQALAAGVLSRHSSPRPRTVLVSSAEAGAGKSTVTAFLGAALARIGRQVILVDGDHRRPCLHRIYHLPGAPGLAEAVQDPTVLRKCLRTTPFPGLRVLTAGSPDADLTVFWHGAMLPEVANQLIAQADIVLWDTPPILISVEATLLAPLADLVLLVVAEDQTQSRQVKLATEQLRQIGCEAAGIVYNKTKESDYGYYYRPDSQRRPKKAGFPFMQKAIPPSAEWELAAQVPPPPALQQPTAELHPDATPMPAVQDATALVGDAASRLPSIVASSPGEKVRQTEYEPFAQRELSGGEVEYLFLDALRKPLPKPRGEEEDVLCAWAIHADGREGLLHIASCSAESYERWLDFLQGMIERGLSAPVLAVAHGTPGVMRAVSEVFPNSLRQRCLALRIREVDEEIPKSARAEVMAMVQAAYFAPNPRVAERISADAVELYGAYYPSAMRLFQKEWETCIAYLRCPPAHHSRIRTTTLLRRSFAEERRRNTDSSNSEAEKGSLDRVFASLWQSSQRWQGIKMSEAERQQLRLLRGELGIPDGRKEAARQQEKDFEA